MVRLAKFLAESGAASRRKAETFILEGRVKVNDQTIKKVDIKVDPEKDKISLDNKTITIAEKIYYLLNKPRGYTSTASDPFAKHSVLELVPKEKRVFPVGRLDRETTGLLIFTNDGDLALKLTHPRYKKEKEYLVETQKELTDKEIKKLEKGVGLEEGKTKPSKLKRLTDNKYSIVISEGKKRQVRRMFASVDRPVVSLKRTRIDFLKIGDLPEGKFRLLTKDEVKRLKNES